MAKGSKAAGNDKNKKGKKAARSDRELLELGQELLTAVHLHQAVQDDAVRAALASAHPELVQAAGDLVARLAERFLENAGMKLDSGTGRWAVPGSAPVEVSLDRDVAIRDVPQSH
jgi:hypothetical protein